MRALVVDDSRTIRMMLKKTLLTQGFETVLEAGDGREALDRLKTEGSADLVLVDWNMPVMDGLDFVTELRRTGQFDRVRVVMITTESEATKVARAMSAGVNAYIRKPFKAEDLSATLETLKFDTAAV